MSKKPSYRIDPENIETSTFLEFTGPLLGKKVLEIGCGSGRFTNRYAAEAKEVVGIDPNRTDIENAKKSNTYSHVQFLEGDILNYNDSQCFDIVVLSWSL